jgi:hypothetical protein
MHQAKYTEDILKKFKMDDSKCLVDTDEYDYNARCELGQRARGPDGVPELDWLPLVLDGDEAEHPVFCVSMRSFSCVAEDFTLVGRQVDLQVSLIHS